MKLSYSIKIIIINVLLLLYWRKLIGEKEKIKNDFYAKVAGSFGRMKGVESALNGIEIITGTDLDDEIILFKT